MTNEELLAALKTEFAAINQRLDALEESNEEIRDSVNVLLKWADDVAVVVKVPLTTA